MKNIKHKFREYMLPSMQGRGWGGVLLLLLFVVACDKLDTPCAVAEHYYTCLVKGDVDGYLRGLHDYETLSDEYRSQLRDMFLQYLDREQQLRGGIRGARAVRDTLIDSLHANVFVELQFGDDTEEQVSLPLIRTDKGWCLK